MEPWRPTVPSVLWLVFELAASDLLAYTCASNIAELQGSRKKARTHAHSHTHIHQPRIENWVVALEHLHRRGSHLADCRSRVTLYLQATHFLLAYFTYLSLILSSRVGSLVGGSVRYK